MGVATINVSVDTVTCIKCSSSADMVATSLFRMTVGNYRVIQALPDGWSMLVDSEGNATSSKLLCQSCMHGL